MRFKKAILLPVYIYTENEIALAKIGMDEEGSGYADTQIRAFWCIDSAHPCQDDKNKTCFYSGGELYTTPGSLGGFVELVNNHLGV